MAKTPFNKMDTSTKTGIRVEVGRVINRTRHNGTATYSFLKPVGKGCTLLQNNAFRQ